jgi:Holliday junction resolvasome RuvABC DNA-binding subunit
VAHPFSKLFDAALAQSTPGDNLLLEEAEALRAKGYSAQEIHGVLVKMQKSLIKDEDFETAKEAAEEMEKYLD